jgi:hypothetical protein
MCVGEGSRSELAKRELSGEPGTCMCWDKIRIFFYHDTQYVLFTLAVEPGGRGLLANVYTRQSLATTLIGRGSHGGTGHCHGNDYVPKLLTRRWQQSERARIITFWTICAIKVTITVSRV